MKLFLSNTSVKKFLIRNKEDPCTEIALAEYPAKIIFFLEN